MIQGQIELVANLDPGDIWGIFDVLISKGRLGAHVDVFGSADTWQEFGQKLRTFPHSTSDCIQLEVSESSQSHLILEAYCYDIQGHAALRVYIDNRQEDPNRHKQEFSIPAEISSLNQLGQLLANWQPETNSELLWQAQTS